MDTLVLQGCSRPESRSVKYIAEQREIDAAIEDAPWAAVRFYLR
jgi:hypothetical protein